MTDASTSHTPPLCPRCRELVATLKRTREAWAEFEHVQELKRHESAGKLTATEIALSAARAELGKLRAERGELRAIILSIPIRTAGGTTRYHRTDAVGAHVDAIAEVQERLKEAAHA